eukprot:scaffold95452_cov40-Prasinocladus_malaysianus.AAC.2
MADCLIYLHLQVVGSADEIGDEHVFLTDRARVEHLHAIAEPGDRLEDCRTAGKVVQLDGLAIAEPPVAEEMLEVCALIKYKHAE